jgi:hypothetical protein
MTAVIERDTDALISLAIKTRRDWDEGQLRRVIADATTIGLSWPKILRRVFTLLLILDSDPGDLVTPEDRRQADADWRTHAAARGGLTGAESQ